MDNRHSPIFTGLTALVALLLLGWISLFAGGTEEAFSEPTVAVRRSCSLFSEHSEAQVQKDCKQCHTEIVDLLQTQGAKHGRIQCRDCHLKDQVYKPGETKPEDITVSCKQCHKPFPHGEKLANCRSCHQKGHAPLNIAASSSLADGCYVCHPKVDKEMKTFVTQHTELYCTGCHHTNHKYIPDCLECHQPHRGTFPAAGGIVEDTTPLRQCLNCHPPHKALRVSYPKDTPNNVCAFCHRKAYEMLSENKSKHSAQRCNFCHPDKHQTIKRCKECHGERHSQMEIKKVNSCGECHGVAHSVVINFPVPQRCVECHENKTPAYAVKSGLWLHAPVNKETCIICHNQHPRRAKNSYLLKEKSVALCTRCHSEGLMTLSEVHRQSKDCIECHNPHLGKNKYLLIKDFKEIHKEKSQQPDSSVTVPDQNKDKEGD